MTNKMFEHFPAKARCPLCGKNTDAPCFLMPIDNTDEDGICQAQPFHADCMVEYADQFRMNREVGVIYAHVALPDKEV